MGAPTEWHVECRHCDGMGSVPAGDDWDPCPVCDGDGWVEDRASVMERWIDAADDLRKRAKETFT